MRSLKDYNLPDEISGIEEKLTSQQIALLADGSTALESNEEHYVKAFRKMLHFEEAAESRFLIQFNAKRIHVRNVSDRQYCIPIEVRNTIYFYFYFFFFFFFCDHFCNFSPHFSRMYRQWPMVYKNQCWIVLH